MQLNPRLVSLLAIITLTISSAFAATYYSKSGQSPSTTAGWSLNSDGSGGSPSNFTTSNDLFVVQAGHSLTSTANFVFGTNVNLRIDGTLNVAAFNITVGGTTVISNGGAFNDNNNSGTNIFTGLVTINAGGTFSTANTSAFTFTGGITNAGTFNKSGTGAVTLNATQNITANANFTAFSGAVTITSGTVTLSGTNNVTFGGAFTVNSGQSFTINSTGITTFTGLFTNNGTVNSSAVTTSANLIFNGGITNAGTSFNIPFATVGSSTITATNAISWSSNNVLFSGVGAYTFAGAGGTTITGTANETFANNLAVTGNLTFAHSGSLSVAGTTVVSGIGNLTDNENTSTSTFTGLVTLTAGTLDLSALSSSNVLVNGGLTYTAGTFNAPNITFNTTGNRTLTATLPLSFASDKLIFAGAGAFTISGVGGVTLTGATDITIPGALTISAGSNLTLNTSGNTTVTGASTVAGSLLINGKTLTALANISVSNGGTLDIGAGGFLKMANGIAVTNAGTFKVVGTNGNPATVTNNGSGNVGISQTATTGIFHAQNYLIDNVRTTGVIISAGKVDTTNNFSNGSFTNGQGGANSTYLNLTGVTLGARTISNVNFGAGQTFNVTRTSGLGTITFQDATGALGYGTAGQTNEKDNAVPGTLINWNTTGNTYYYQGNGNFSVLANWNTAANGSGAALGNAAKLTDASSTFIIQAGQTVTVDANIAVTSLQLGANSTLIVGSSSSLVAVSIEGDFTVPATASVINNSTVATHTFTVKGNLTVNGTLQFYKANWSVVNLTLEGTAKTFTPNANTTLNNLTLNTGAYSSVSYTLASNLTLIGSVTINANATLNDGGNTISVGGNWYQTSLTAFSSTGLVQFNGTGMQAIGGSAPYNFGITFNNVSLNGTSNTVILNTASIINGAFFATNGVTVVASNINVTYNGNFALDAGATYSSAGTSTFGGANPQNIDFTNTSFTNVTFSGAGLKTTSGVTGSTLGLFFITSSATVTGASTINCNAGLRVDGTCNLSGTINMTGGSIYTGAASNTYSLGTATVNITGSISLSFTSPATSGALTVGGNVFILNPNNIANQYLIMNNNTSLQGTGSNTFNQGSNANLWVRGANNFPTNFGAFNLDVNSGVIYDMNANQTVRGNVTYGNLFLRANTPSVNLSPVTKTADGSITVNGTLSLGGTNNNTPLIYDLITFDLGTFDHYLNGSLTNTLNSSITASAGTFNLTAQNANQTIATTTGNYNFYNFNIDQGLPTASRTKTFNASINVAGYFQAVNSGGDANNTLVINFGTNSLNGSGGSSNFTLGANVIFQTANANFGTSMATFGGTKQIDPLSTFAYNFAGNQAIATGFSYGNLLLQGAGAKTVNADLDINGYLNASGTAILTDGVANLNYSLAGDLLIQSANYTSPTANITLDGTNQSILASGGTANVNNLILANTGNKTINGTLNVLGNVSFTVAPTFSNPVLDANTRAVNIGGNLNITDGVFKQTTGTTTFNGNSAIAQNVTSNADSYFGNFTINRQGANKTVQILSDLVVNGNLTLEYDRLTTPVVGYADFNTTGFDVTVGGSFNYFPLTTLTSTGSTYFFNGNSVQSILYQGTGAFNNLEFSNAGVKRFSNSISYNGNNVLVNGNITNNGSTVDMATNGVDMTVLGNWVNTGVFQGNGRTITFNGAEQTISNTNFGHVVIGGTKKKTLTGAITLAGNLTINANDTLDVSANNYSITVSGNWNQSNAGAAFISRNGTVTFTGNNTNIYTGSIAAAATSTPNLSSIPAGKSFYNVVLNKATGSSLTLNTLNGTFGDLSITNDFNITTGTFTTNGYDVWVGGNLVVADFYNANSVNSALTFNPSINANYNFDPGTNVSSVFRDIYFNAGTSTYTLQNNLNITNNNTGTTGFIANSGTFTLNGKQLRFGTTFTGNVLTLAPSTTLNVDAGAIVALANGNILLNAGGNLNIIGTSVNPATITRSGTGGYTVSQTSGKLSAQNYSFQYLNNVVGDNGLSISGGTIDAINNLSNGVFINGLASSAQYLNLDGYAGDSIIAQNVVFNAGPTKNVKFLTSTNPNSKIIFASATGSLVGATFETDDANANTGKIKWRNTGIFWKGGTDNNWFTASNWSTGNVPTAIDTVYLDHRVVTAAYTVNISTLNTNATAYRLIIDKGASANAIGLTLGNNSTLTVGENVNVLAGNNLTISTSDNQINVGGNWTFAATATLTATAGTVNFNPTTGTKFITTPTTNPSISAFYNFSVNTSNGATVQLSSPIFVNNDINVANGNFDVSAGNLAIDIKGNWNVGNNGNFNPRLGTVTFSKVGASTQTINAGPFYNLTTSSTVAGATKQITGNLTILNTIVIGANTTIDAGTNSVFVGGSWTNNSSASALINTGAGVVNFNGTAAQTIDNGSFATIFNNITLQGVGGKTWAANSTVNGDFNVSASAGTLNFNIFTINGAGGANSFIVSGANNIQLRGANNFPTGFESITLTANSTVNYYSDLAQTIALVPSPGYGNLIVQKVTTSGSSTKTVSAGNLILQGGLTIADVYSVIDFGANNADLTLPGNISMPTGGQQIVWGTGTSTLYQVGTATWDIDADITSFNNMSLAGSGTKRLNNNLNVTGNLIVNSSVILSLNNSAGTAFKLSGTGSGKNFNLASGATLSTAIASPDVAFATGFDTYTIDQSSTVLLNAGNGINQIIKSDISYGNLTISNNTKNVTINAGSNLDVKGAFTVTTNGSPNAAATLFDNGQNITVTGDVLFGIYTPSASTVKLTLNGANQTVRCVFNTALSLGTVEFNGSGIKTFGDASDVVIVAGNLSIATGVTVNSVNNLTFSGTSWTNLGTWNHTANTVTFANSAPLAINPGTVNTFASVLFSGTSSVIFGTNGATFTGASFVLNGAGLSVDFGTLTHNIAGSTTITAGTWVSNNANFNFNGGNQTITGFTARNIVLANSGTKTMAGEWTINHLTINTGVTLNTSASSFNLNVAGHWKNSGAFTPNTSTVTFNGALPIDTINNNTSRFYIANFAPTAAVTYHFTAATTFILLSSNANANAYLSLQSNTLVLGSPTYSPKIFNIAGTLDVTQNGALKFDNTFTFCTLNFNGGTFRIVGSSALIASVSQFNTNNSYQNGHQINVIGGRVFARYYLIRDLADQGLQIDAASTLDAVNNFSDGTWSNIRTNTTTPRRYLQLDCPSPGTDIANVTFNYSGSPTAITTGAYNVKRSASATGAITFVSALGGNLGDFKFEDDAAGYSATTGLIIWPLVTNLTWTGAVSTEWNDPANWSPSFVPDLTKNATIVLANNNPIVSTAAAFCKNLIISNGQLTLQNTFTLNTKGDISVGTGTSLGVLTVLSAGNVINCEGNWTRGTNGIFTHGRGKVVFTGATGASTITPLSSPFFNVEFNNDISVFYLVGNTINIAGSITIIDGQVYPNNSNYTLNIGGNVNCQIANGASFSPATIGTVVLNGENQAITDATFYNLTVAGTGVKSTTGIITIIGATTINSGATLLANPYSSIDFRGNVVINAGGTFNDGDYQHTFKGQSWTGNGTYTGAGAVTFNLQGAQTQTINNATFNTLKLNTGGGTVVFAGTVNINDTLLVDASNGAVNVNIGASINNGTGTGKFILTTGKTLNCYGVNSFPTNFAVNDLQTSSSVFYYGTGNQSIAGVNYANLYLNNNTVKSLLGDINVKGVLQMNNSTLDVTTNNYAINLQGTWFNTSTGTFIPRQGTVTLDGTTANQNINIGASATNPFYNLNIIKGSFTAFATINTTIQNDLSVITGTFSPNGYIVYVGKNLTASSGTFANSGTYYLNYTGANIINIQTNGSTLSNLTLDGVGTNFVANDNITVAGNFRLLNGTFNGNNKVINLGSGGNSILINGTYQIGAGGVMALGNLCTVAINGTLEAIGTSGASATITRNTLGGTGSRYSGFQVNSGGTIKAQYYLIEYMGSGGILINSGATIDPTNNFSNGTFTNGVSGGVYLDIENNQKLTQANRIVNISFSINPGGGAKNVMKTRLPGDTIEFYNASGIFAGSSFENDPNGLIKWSGPVILTWNGTVNTDWFNAGNWSANFGSAVVPTGVENVVIANSTNQPVINLTGASTSNLTINANAILTVTTADAGILDLVVNGDITINGTLALSTANDGISVAGNWQKATSGTVSISNGTVTLTAAIVKNINNGTGSFGNLIVNSTSTVSLGANTVVTKDFSLLAGALDVSTSNYQLTVGGNFYNNGFFIARAGKLVLNATSGTKTINAGSSVLNMIDLNPTAGVIYRLNGNNLTTQGNVNIQAGTLDLNSLTYNMGDGIGSDVLSVGNGASLLVGGNSALKFGNLASLNVNNGGTFRLVGSSLAKALLSAQSGTYAVNIYGGATIHAKNYIVEYINNSGIYVRNGATIDATNNFSKGSFSYGTTGGTFLQLENSFADYTADSVVFNSGVAYNVTRTLGTGVLTFSDPSGATGNFSFEKDETSMGASIGLLRWIYTTPTSTWLGLTSANWNEPNNWTNGVPTSQIVAPATQAISAIVGNVSSPLFAPVINNTSGDASVNNLLLLAGATLNVADAKAFTIGGSFTNNGTFNVSGASAITVGGSWSDNGTVSAGTSTITLNGTVAGTKTISTNATALNNIIIGSSATYQLSNAIILNGNVTIQNGGVLNANSSSNSISLKGNWTNNGTFFPNTASVNFTGTSGTQSITAGTGSTKAFYNVTKTSNSSISLNTDLTVTNNLTVSAGNLDANFYNIYVGGSYTYAAGNLIDANMTLTGSNNQTLTNSLGANGSTFNNLTINKTAGSKVTLVQSITVNGTLNLTSGNVVLSGRNITLGTSAVISGGSTSSYIQADGVGTLIKNLNAGNIGTTFTLPIGDASRYTPISFKLNSGTLTASANIAVNLRNSKDPNLTATNDFIRRYWEIVPTGITSPNYNVSYVYQDADVVGDETKLTPAKYSTATASPWNYGYMYGTWNLNTTTNTISWNGVTSFSRYTGVVSSAPVPVTFIKHAAQEKGNKVNVTFTTGMELNSKEFVIEASEEGIYFDSIATVKAVGNSTQWVDYAIAVEENNHHYFRIKEIDLDGSVQYSSIFILNDEIEHITHFKVYPNPINHGDNINLNYETNAAETPITVTIVDITEKVHYKQNFDISHKGTSTLHLLTSEKLASGVYIITITTPTKVYTQKLVVD